MEVDRGQAAFFGDENAHSALYADQTLAEESYNAYRRHPVVLLLPDRGLHGKSHNVKAQSELLCSSPFLNGAYKCVKCSKVRMERRKMISFYFLINGVCAPCVSAHKG